MATHGAGTPGPEGQPGGTNEVPTDGQDFDYVQGYTELRPKFTQTTQALAEAQQRASQYEALFETLQDPESPEAQELLAELGYEMETDPDLTAEPPPDADEWADPLEAEVRELKELTARLVEEREQEALTAQEQELETIRDDYIDDAIAFIAQQPGQPEFTDDEQEILGNLAIAMKDEDGVPDVQAAYNRLYGEDGLLEINRARWIDTKTGALRAPHGHSGASDKRPTNRRERVAFLSERMQRLDAQQ